MEVFLGLHSVFDGFADEGIGVCSLYIIDIEVAEVRFLGDWGANGRWVDDVFFSDGGVIAYSLKMLFVSGFEVLFSLRDFYHV